MTILRSYVDRIVLPSSPSVSDVRNLLLLPESLGGYFFGISSVVFFLTARNVYSKVSSTLHKSLALAGLGIGFLLALLFHAQAAADLRLYSSANCPQDVCDGVYIQASLEYRDGLVPMAPVIFMVSSWISGALLIWRAFVLSGRKRWVLAILKSVLVVIILHQIIRLWPRPADFARLAYPIDNLVLAAIIGIVVVCCHVNRDKDQGEPSLVAVFSDIIIDSGLVLTVALAIYLWHTHARMTDIFFSRNVIFHIHNITSCMLISRIVDSAYSSGAVRLGDDIDH